MYKSPTTIPLINLRKITNVPLAIYIGANDNLVTPTDGKWLKSQVQANLSYYREMGNFDNFQLVNFPTANKIDYFDNDILVKIKAANPLDFSFPVINVFVQPNNTVDNSTTDNTNSTTNDTNNNTIINPPNNPTPSPNNPKPSPNNPNPSPNNPNPSPNNPTPQNNNGPQAPSPAVNIPPKSLRFLYNPPPVTHFWDAIARDFYIFISNLPLLSILFRDIPFWFNVVVTMIQIFGIDQDDSLVVMGFLFKNQDAVLLLKQQALLLNIVPKYERYAKNGNPFAIEFVKTFKDSDQVYTNNSTWNLWEKFGVYNYYMMFTW